MNKLQDIGPTDAEPVSGATPPANASAEDDRQRIRTLESEGRKLRAALREAHHLVKELIDLADRDPLVEILNRRAFIREMTRVMTSVDRYNFQANLVYLDLNGFKNINDSYGHAAGDAVLKYVGETLVSHIRQTDSVGRLGGDEFGIILVHTSSEMAELKMDQLAKSIASKPMLWHDREVPVSFSYGVLPISGQENVEALLHEADQAMYAQKKALQSSPADSGDDVWMNRRA